MFWSAFGCAQHPKAGQNTQQLGFMCNNKSANIQELKDWKQSFNICKIVIKYAFSKNHVLNKSSLLGPPKWTHLSSIKYLSAHNYYHCYLPELGVIDSQRS